jgi:hypothetical protein
MGVYTPCGSFRRQAPGTGHPEPDTWYLAPMLNSHSSNLNKAVYN